MRRLLQARRALAAFHPRAGQRVYSHLPDGVFGIERTSLDETQRLVCLHETSGVASVVAASSGEGRDVLSGEALKLDRVTLGPYQARWVEVVPSKA
jgi:hypothetical protein